MAASKESQPAEGSQADAEPHIFASELERARILDACERKDIDGLRDIAIAPGGFLSDQLRSRACRLTDLLFPEQRHTCISRLNGVRRADTAWF